VFIKAFSAVLTYQVAIK